MSTDRIPLLIEPKWVEENRHETDVRILDCTVHLGYDEETGERRIISGREGWQDSHIPGSEFVDVATDLSGTDAEYRFELPGAERFADAVERVGVSDDSRVVLYDRTNNMWATRVWWLLRTYGFENAGVLNGGWTGWTAEDRPVSSSVLETPRGSFTPEFRPELVADKKEVLAAIDDGATCLLNARRPRDHAGTGLIKDARPGHIPSSVNVPAIGDDSLVDPTTARYRSREELRHRFAAAGIDEDDRIVAYCGGAIAATSAAFALELLGFENVAVYDGSIAEWSRDPTLPMVTADSGN